MKLKAAIKHFGSQLKIAEKLGVSEGAVSKWGSRNKGIIPLKSAMILQDLSGNEVDLMLTDYRRGKK